MRPNEIAEIAELLEGRLQDEAFALMKKSAEYGGAKELIDLAADVGRIRVRIKAALSPAETEEVTKNPLPIRTSSSRTQAAYPRFFVKDGRLVKIGKGKQKTAKEYRHEASRETFDAVCSWVDRQSVSGIRIWAAADAETELTQGGSLAYQVYLVIAALRQIGVLRQVARGQYEVGAAAGTADDWWMAIDGEASLDQG